jgi:hypothetical protein
MVSILSFAEMIKPCFKIFVSPRKKAYHLPVNFVRCPSINEVRHGGSVQDPVEDPGLWAGECEKNNDPDRSCRTCGSGFVKVPEYAFMHLIFQGFIRHRISANK